jgi:hypothetical protein
MVFYVVNKPKPMTTVYSVGHYEYEKVEIATIESMIPYKESITYSYVPKFIEGESNIVIDEEKVANERFDVCIFWFWPVYFIGLNLSGKWALKNKNRNLHWLWLTNLIPLIPLVLDNRNTY